MTVHTLMQVKALVSNNPQLSQLSSTALLKVAASTSS